MVIKKMPEAAKNCWAGWALGALENTVEIGWFCSFNPHEKYKLVQVSHLSMEMSEAL